MLTTRILVALIIFTGLAQTSSATSGARTKKAVFERQVNVSGFRGKVTLRELIDSKIAVQVKTGRSITYDTVSGFGLFPVSVNGRKQQMYVGKFGDSRYPMLIFAVGHPKRAQDSRVLCYQLSSTGTLIGQQVIVDDNLKHGHSDELSGGRYQLAALDPSLGAIYSVSYQDARFEGYYVSYEKLRVRQWDETINTFVEADQGFLRERNGRLIHSSQFHALSDQRREEIFLANLEPSRPRVVVRRELPKVIPASAQK